MIDSRSGAPLMIDVHRRMLPATHSGPLVGIDLAAALRAPRRHAIGATTHPKERAGGSHSFRMWYREPRSAWLTAHPPTRWHDPPLLEAMLRIPTRTMRRVRSALFPRILDVGKLVELHVVQSYKPQALLNQRLKWWGV